MSGSHTNPAKHTLLLLLQMTADPDGVLQTGRHHTGVSSGPTGPSQMLLRRCYCYPHSEETEVLTAARVEGRQVATVWREDRGLEKAGWGEARKGRGRSSVGPQP